MMPDARARALRYVATLIEGYERNLRWARRSESSKAVWLETCLTRLRRELGEMQGESPEGRVLAGRWAFLTEGL